MVHTKAGAFWGSEASERQNHASPLPPACNCTYKYDHNTTHACLRVPFIHLLGPWIDRFAAYVYVTKEWLQEGVDKHVSPRRIYCLRRADPGMHAALCSDKTPGSCFLTYWFGSGIKVHAYGGGMQRAQRQRQKLLLIVSSDESPLASFYCVLDLLTQVIWHCTCTRCCSHRQCAAR